MSIIGKIKQALGINRIEAQQETAAAASQQTAQAIANLTELVGRLVSKIDQPKIDQSNNDAIEQLSKMRSAMAEQEQLVSSLKNQLEAAKADAVAAFLTKAKETVSSQRQAGRPKIDGTNINLRIRAELFDQMTLIGQVLPGFKRTEFINEAIAIRIEQVIEDNPQWRSVMAEVKQESTTDPRQMEMF